MHAIFHGLSSTNPRATPSCGSVGYDAGTAFPLMAAPPTPSPIQISYSKRTISAKALKVLGATQDDVRFERALLLSAPNSSPSASGRVFVECTYDDDETADPSKPAKILGLSQEQPLQWLQSRGGADAESDNNERRLPSKALKQLGATIDDVRIEKALLVLGEAPGREIPGGKLPRPEPDTDDAADYSNRWAVPPPVAPGISIFLCAFLPWGILAPLNVLKLQLNKVSPGAHLWVPAETEQCQAACGIARMWATLFWSMQFANAVACIYLHYNRERGLATLAVAHKLVVGTVLFKAYLSGVIYWPIGLGGTAIEYFFALAFARALRKK